MISRTSLIHYLRKMSVACLIPSAVMLVCFRFSHPGAGEIQALVFGTSEYPLYGILLAAIGFAFAFAFQQRARIIATVLGFAILALWF